MRYLIFSIYIISSLVASGQTDLVFFTEEGEKFTLYVNGLQANEEPAIRVKSSDVSGDFAQIKIVFETPGAPEIKKGMMLEARKEMTSVIKKNNKGKYVFRPVSIGARSSSQESEVVPITNAASAPATPTPTSSNSTTSTAANESDTETIGISVSMGDQSVGVSVNMSGSSSETSSQQSSSSSSAHTQVQSQQLSARVEGKKIILSDGRTYTFNYYNANRIGPVVEVKNPAGARATISYDGVESYSGEIPFQYNEEDWKKSKAYFKLTVIEEAGSWSVKLKHSGKIIIDGPSGQGGTSMSPAVTQSATTGCATPMAEGNYNRAKESIEGKSFEDEKMTVFKQITRANCFSVNQVVGFIKLFTYEEEKLEVAKLAYPKTVDKGNYYQVNDAFTYSDTIEELEDFLSDQ